MKTNDIPKLNSSRSSAIWLAVTFALIVLLCLKSYLSPAYNWDMLCYVGNAMSDESDPQELHRRVYQAANNALPADVFIRLTELDEPEYRRTLRHDANAFSVTLPLFGQRVLYVGLIRSAYLLGADPFRASVAISAAAVCALFFVLTLWLANYIPAQVLPGIVPLIFFATSSQELARLSTPDSLATLLCTVSLWLIFKPSACPGCGLLSIALAIFARTESVVLGAMLLAALLSPLSPVLGFKWKQALVWSGVFAAATAYLSHFHPSYSWRLLISYCMIDHSPYPHEVAFGAVEYASLCLRAFRTAINSSEYVLWVAVWLAGLCLSRSPTSLRPIWTLLLLVGANLGVRLAIFPALDYRYHSIFFVTTAFAITAATATHVRRRRSDLLFPTTPQS